MKIHLLVFCAFLSTVAACQSQRTDSASTQAQPAPDKERQVGGPCECCEAIFDDMPEKLTWETQISPKNEPGEPLEISGTIFKSDGITPVEGIILYVYHTDNQGLYSRGSKTSKCADRHGLLRGWMKTGPDGRYLFRTIRPASYPNTNFAQHIHPEIKEPGLQVYWIDEYVFADDPKLVPSEIAKHQNRGGSGVLYLKKNEAGTWIGQRDIVLGKNVPGY